MYIYINNYVYIYKYIHTYQHAAVNLTHLITSNYISEGVRSHIWMRHITDLDASWHTYARVVMYPFEWIWTSHVTLLNDSCHVCECVMWYHCCRRLYLRWGILPHVRMARIEPWRKWSESWHTSECGMSHLELKHMVWLRLVGSIKL